MLVEEFACYKQEDVDFELGSRFVLIAMRNTLLCIEGEESYFLPSIILSPLLVQ